MNGTLVRPALGQAAPLGRLYDARSDTFIPLSILSKDPGEDAVTSMDNPQTDVNYGHSESYRDKFSLLNISAELSVSFLSGLVTVEGSGSYLSETKNSRHVLEMSFYHDIKTKNEILNIGNPALRERLFFEALEGSGATHIVAEIGWGSRTIITAKYTYSKDKQRDEVHGELSAAFEKLKMIKISGEAELDHKQLEKLNEKNFEISVHADVLAEDGLVPTNFATALEFVSKVPEYIKKSNDGKGKPLVYTLLPVNVLKFLFQPETKAEIILKQLAEDTLGMFVDLFDKFRQIQQTVDEYDSFISTRRSYVPGDHIEEVKRISNEVQNKQAKLKSEFAVILKAVRGGEMSVDKLNALYAKFHEGEGAPTDPLAVMSKYSAKIELIDSLVQLGARYIGYNGVSPDAEIAKNKHDDAFVFYFNEQVRHYHKELWFGNFTTLLGILNDKTSPRLILLVDCDAVKDQPRLTKPQIVLYRGGKRMVNDYYEQQKLFDETCLMRYMPDKLERQKIEKPISRRAVLLPCPNLQCDQNKPREWICSQCHSLAEYGHTDRYIYCDCGRTLYSEFEFRCNSPTHGSAFLKYDATKLLALLKALEPFPELNILILGETGVGKSTFINAFLNYVHYDTLQEALDADELSYLVPCSFATQTVDENDPDGKLIQHHIEVGHCDDERDGSGGQSATQKTQVYPFRLGGVNVRLIDTPGIGDTRGVEQDKQNMADILSVLANYQRLHGILILLKPNNTRLNVVFRFCMKELLTHLHHDATSNMVFGFTNARSSNYQPGDTFIPLETLLKEFNHPKLGLYQRTVYCFDSESFRYLAAQKQNGLDLGNWDDYVRSWDHSFKESRRLMEYFRSLSPHEVQSTVSLNQSRTMIAQLTKPMAEIAETILASIEVNKDDIKYINQKELSLSELKSKLYVKIIGLKSHQLDQPRTVCGHASCIELRDVGDGKQSKKVVFKKFCHNPCYLNNIKPDTVGFPGLVHCHAFRGKQICSNCNHSWQEHLHVLYELREKLNEQEDKKIKKLLDQGQTDINVKKRAVESKERMIQEFKDEHRQIQEAAVDFSIFLKNHSITPYNDAMIEYLNHLIKEEKNKIAVGGSDDRLKLLEASKTEYKELIEVFKTNIATKGHEALDVKGVRNKIQQLYDLPHHGQMLKDTVETVVNATADTFREKPFVVPSKYKAKWSDWWERVNSPYYY
ncbi:hypothetical protein BDV30DRAFT_244581 [Aspergillus minisclerotigenes]|uniref:G domain-containing protein n=1 Tax=Aspergillus minisclerotigenes TaxID=656917 RepID=A0A5N6ILQ1_9EURO|nr:hypothetical protein BDV30DRAFT_244581 [Aspergillus minisclerotigenes]